MTRDAFGSNVRRDADWDRWVRRIHDTRSGEDLRGIGHADADTLVSWHATDDPDRLVRFIRRRRDLVQSFGPKGAHAELGPGLYLGNPAVWQVRGRNKWAFLDTLTGEQMRRLAEQLAAEVDRAYDRGHISRTEHTQALYRIQNVVEGAYGPEVLVSVLANQPFNIQFWRDEFLAPIGIRSSPTPAIVEVRVRGRFAELSGSHPPSRLLRLLRRAGVQGVFTRANMSTNPELVVWDRRAIVGARLDPEGYA